MKNFMYILLLLMACRKEPERLDPDTAIYGLWVAGEMPKIQVVDFVDDGVVLAENEFMELIYPDGERANFVPVGDTYELQSERFPAPEERLVLNWYQQGDTASVVVDMPASPIQVLVQNDTLVVGQPEGALVQWVAPMENYEYALRLDCLEENKVPLPWSPGNFGQLFSGPQIATQAALPIGAFSFYGAHKLTVTVLNESIVDVFFFNESDIRGRLRNGPNNVSRGRGFVAGVSTMKVFLEIE